MSKANPLSPLDAKQRGRLTQVQRYLLNVTDPTVSGVAAKAGYDAAEHREGWALLDAAAGRARPFEHFLSAEVRRAASTGPVAGRYRELDDFENTWFVLARNAIRRFVAPDRREAVERAFFADMAQQPEGPEVVGSVAALLSRLDGLRRSDVPGADAAWRSLVKKGLTDEVLARTAAQVAAFKAEAAPEPEAPDEARVRADAEAQLAAYEQLMLWFNDWADALRPRLSYHQLVRLGLTSRKGGPSRGREEADEEEPADVDGL